MKLLLIPSIIFLVIVGFFNFVSHSWLFFLGIGLIFLIFLFLNHAKSNQGKKFKLILLILILLNFIPFPRNEHPYSTTFAEYYEPAAWGIGFPGAYMKFFTNCPSSFNNNQSSLNPNKMAYISAGAQGYLNRDRNCPSDSNPITRLYSLVIDSLVFLALIPAFSLFIPKSTKK